MRHLIPVTLLQYRVVMPFCITGLWFWGYIFGSRVLFHPEYQHPIHIYYIKHENAFTCKRICWYFEGNNVEKIFFYLLYVYYRKRRFQPKNKVVHLFKIENWIQYHKIGSNSKLIRFIVKIRQNSCPFHIL